MQLQSVKPLLALTSEFVIKLRSWWWDAFPTLHPVRLFSELSPLGLSGFFSLVGAILQLVVVVRAVVEKLRIDFHEELHGVVDHPMDRSELCISSGLDRTELGLPVPMALRVLVQRRKHDGKDGLYVVAYKIAEVFVVPKVERSFCDLGNVRRGHK